MRKSRNTKKKMDEEQEEAGSAEEEAVEMDENTEHVDTTSKTGRSVLSGRGVTLNMLMNDKILWSGEGVLSIDYLGTKFLGDLLEDGRIRWQETGEVFSSPSAWAIHCKKLLNPDKKSGCGWSSIKYKGKKLDSFKTAWFRRLKQQGEADAKVIKKASEIIRLSRGKPSNLAILQAFPCRSQLGDKDTSAMVEEEIRQGLEQRHLTVVGWYHSHPTCSVQPTVKDVDSQMEYQIIMKGENDSTYTPCLGFICSPYNMTKSLLEAEYLAYWVMPPPEHRPHEYGRPMEMIYTVAQDSFLTQDLLTELRLLADFYRGAPDAINFSHNYCQNGITYWEKLRSSLSTKLPRDLQVSGNQSIAQMQAVTHFWSFLKGLVSA
ncbi:MPN domain-containing protein-like [Centruroides sculpturatus]|uniref:MPN domain-containing protein-like n=1 Tax=Centruroides sculpturatus TaxID=218467 RepID=UPI000C6D7C8B|nr:MPN domain-containing protein-like [Centruroides sculpturatus]